MALVLADRVRETTAVVSTGPATLLGASTGYQSLAVIGDGNTTLYCIADQVGPNWEVGIGTYTLAGTTLARTTVLASSNGGALVNFSAGTKDVFVTYPAEKSVNLDAVGNCTILLQLTAAELLASNGLIINNMTIATTYAIPAGYSASSVGPVTVAGGVTVTVPSGSRWVVL